MDKGTLTDPIAPIKFLEVVTANIDTITNSNETKDQRVIADGVLFVKEHMELGCKK